MPREGRAPFAFFSHSSARFALFRISYGDLQNVTGNRKRPLSCDNSGGASFQLAESWGFEPQMGLWPILA